MKRVYYLMGAAEIAAFLDLSQSRVHQIVKEQTSFPAPVATLRQGRIWSGAAIERWAKGRGR